MEDNKDIKQFVADICNKEYNKANESLHKMIENKIKDRVREVAQEKN